VSKIFSTIQKIVYVSRSQDSTRCKHKTKQWFPDASCY